MGFTSIRCQTLLQAIIVYNFKENVSSKLNKIAKNILGLILAPWPRIWAIKFFFLKNLASSVPRCHDQLSSCTISEKTNDPILRKFSDGQTDGQTSREINRWADGWTDKQTDESDFIGHCATNVDSGVQYG